MYICVRFVHVGDHSRIKIDQILSSCIVHKKPINIHQACIPLMVHRSCLHGASVELYPSFHQAFFKQYIVDVSSEEKTMVLKREIMNNNKLGYLNL